jgi:TM2 domain-containing membrane protein YozV/predicted RNA-binding Zn-ribbon protein involved in translation (DUF1610 family)
MSGTVRFDCSSCGKRLKASSSLAGKNGKCPSCGDIFSVPFVQVDADDDFDMPSYAAPRPSTKYCHYCGQVIASLAEICPKCGVRQPDMPGVGSPSHPSSPSKVVACLFALFLGIFGVHRFYLGETTWGVFYLVLNVFLFWTIVVPLIFLVVTFVEGISYLTYSDADFARKYSRRAA